MPASSGLVSRNLGRAVRFTPRVLITQAQQERSMRKFWIAALSILAAVVAWTSGAPAADKASQKFITEAIQGNLAEIAVGKLAQQKGQSDGVRSFGAQLVSDHTAANDKAMSVAQSMGVSPPSEPNKKQK